MNLKDHLLHFWLFIAVFTKQSCECRVKGNFLKVSRTFPAEEETNNSTLKPNNNDIIESHSNKKNRAPTFKREWNDPDPMYVHEFADKKFSLNCSVKARPRPCIKWYKNNQEIRKGEDRP